MGIFRSKTPLEAEMARLARQEQKRLEKAVKRQEPRINVLLDEKVPEKLRDVLGKAFAKAFVLIFEKGAGVLEMTYDREKLEKEHLTDLYAMEVMGDRKTLRAFAKKARNSGTKNLLLSGVSGVGLGVLGIGIPDVPLFTGLMLKGVYETALRFGFGYDSEDERYFILLLIQGAFARGESADRVDREINAYIGSGRRPPDQDMEGLIRQTAEALAGELLYLKFLQGMPLVGAVGGAYDVVYMKRVVEYAQLKYRYRLYHSMGKESSP